MSPFVRLLGCSVPMLMAVLMLASWPGGSCAGAPRQAIRDLTDLPQDCRAYIPPGQGNTPLLGAKRQQAAVLQLRRELFAPWQADRAPPDPQHVSAVFARFSQERFCDGSSREHAPGWIRGLRAASALGDYPNCGRRGITIRNTNLRDLPTAEPCYEAPDKPGGGPPFDMAQNSALWTGTPLLVCHTTPAGWAFADTPLGSGWVPAADVALAGDEFVRRWRERPLAAVTADDTATALRGGGTGPRVHIGTVLPMTTEGETALEVLIPVADAAGQAEAVAACLPRTSVSPLPQPLTPAAVAELANRMVGQGYGWGGLGELRDCSATTHDLLVPFGLWLPRNSIDQARAGRAIPLKHLTGAQREEMILKRGVPWLTLIYSPGHVMLYVGPHRGRAVILHNFWGVPIRRDGRDGRLIIARCALTTLQPGIELPDLALPEGDRREFIESMILLAPTDGGEGPSEPAQELGASRRDRSEDKP